MLIEIKVLYFCTLHVTTKNLWKTLAVTKEIWDDEYFLFRISFGKQKKLRTMMSVVSLCQQWWNKFYFSICWAWIARIRTRERDELECSEIWNGKELSDDDQFMLEYFHHIVQLSRWSTPLSPQTVSLNQIFFTIFHF